MAGAMRKMAVYLGLVEDDRYDDEYDDYDERDDLDLDDERGPAPRRAAEPVGRSAARDERPTVTAMPERRVDRLSTHPAAAPAARSATGQQAYRITTIHPRTYNEAKTVGEAFRAGTPVIMNLSEMDDADAKRLVDFAAGLIFGLRGTIDRVSTRVFLLSPANISVTAEDKARIAEGGFFNQS